MANVITGNEVASIKIPHTQVYMATHDGGDNRLPYRYRSFISFSFGGKWIEDFNLIATVDGDRMEKSLTGEFEDLTSSYDVLDGQFYHSTHFRTNTISFTLSTDGIDQKQLEAFRNWFAPGKTRELILSEHPNRAIMARISTVSEMHMLPFEKQIELTIAGVKYTTSTTNYKGDISLELVMDDPFWYSIINIFGKVSYEQGQVTYINEWQDADGNTIQFLLNNPEAQTLLKDILKIVYEDGIPMYSMIASPMLFGDDVYAVSGGRMISTIAQPISAEEYAQNHTSEGYYDNGLKEGADDFIYYENEIDPETNQMTYHQYYKGGVIETAVIDGAFVTNTTNSPLNLVEGDENAIKLYYAGTAPAPIKICFTIPITLNGDGYIDSIASNTFNKINGKSYNTITFESKFKKELRLTTPNFLTSYNKTLYKLKNSVGMSFEELRSYIRDEIRHPEIRKIAINIINYIYSGNTSLTTIDGMMKDDMVTEMVRMFGEGAQLELTLDSKTGESKGTYTYNYIEISSNPEGLVASSKDLTENIGDMLSSNYIILDEKNNLDDNMLVQGWTENHKDYSYRVYHDFPVELKKFSIEYKNLYY